MLSLKVICALWPNCSAEFMSFSGSLGGVHEGALTWDWDVLLADFSTHVGNDRGAWLRATESRILAQAVIWAPKAIAHPIPPLWTFVKERWWVQNTKHKMLNLLQRERHNSVIHKKPLDMFTDWTDDQRSGVFPPNIMTWTEVWQEFLSEGAAAEGEDEIWSIYVIKGDPTLFVLHKHPHLLRSTLQGQTDTRARASYVMLFISQNNGPVSVLWICFKLSVSFDRLFYHS